MAFCNPKEELSALLCNIPSNWRDPIVRALTCILSLKRDDEVLCDSIKECETLTQFQPISVSGNVITFSYRDEKGTIYNRSVNITTIVNNLLDDIDASCLMPQEDWDELTFTERLAAIYAKACCVHGDCSGGNGGSGGSGCGCEDCGDGEGGDDEPCIGLNACRCTQYIITGVAPYTFSYKDCDTKLVTEYDSISNVVEICALRNSLVLPLNVLYEEVGDCGATTTTSTTTSTSTTTTSSSTTTTTTEEPTTTTTTTTTSSSSTTTTTTEATTTTTTTTTSTTTSSSTTTTTTAEPLNYYLADEYSCSDCFVPTNPAILVTLPAAHSVQVGKFYIPVVNTGHIYNIVDPDPQSPASAIDLTTSNYTTCGGACDFL